MGKSSNLSRFKATTDHPKWNWKDQVIDLRTISDDEAADLVKNGFPFLEVKILKSVLKS